MTDAPTPTTTTSPPEVAPPVAAPTAPTTTQSSVKLARGEIPSTWTKPAEVVTTLPGPAGRPVLSAALVGAGVVSCLVLAVVLLPPPAPSARAPAVVAPAAVVVPVVVTPAGPAPIEKIPTPPPTSSTRPGPIAPEDQGGELAPAPPSAVPDMLGELPQRKKAKGLTGRAIAALRDGDFAGAEPLLVRAVIVDPTFPDAWRHLGIARAQMGDRDGARRAYRKYLLLAPDAPDAGQVRAILAQ